jgi:ERF superfamily protein
MATATSDNGPSSTVVTTRLRHATLAAALAAFQAEVPQMQKDETAKVKSEKANYTYGYAGLDQFVEIVEPVLGKHGLSITSISTFDDKGNFILEVKLLHESGEELGPSIWPLPDPRRAGPQDIGSSMTYGRRYLGWGLTGTFPGGIDDDGQKAQQAHRESWDDAQPRMQNAPVSAPPAQQPKTSWTDDEVLKLIKPMPTADISQALKVYDWMAGKNLHKRVVEMDYEGRPVKVSATDLVACRIADEAMIETASLGLIKTLQDEANTRGLMKVKVSDTETLAEALYAAQELAQHAADEKRTGSQ